MFPCVPVGVLHRVGYHVVHRGHNAADVACGVDGVFDFGGRRRRRGIAGVGIPSLCFQLIQLVIFVFRDQALGIGAVDGEDLVDLRNVPVGVVHKPAAGKDLVVGVSERIGPQPGGGTGAVTI